MEDPKTSQASSSDTRPRPKSRPSFGPLIFNANISPILGVTPSPRVQTRRPQLGISIPTSLSPRPLPLPFRGCGPPPKKLVKNGANCKIRPQWPKNRCIQFLLQKCEIGVILSDMSRHARPIGLRASGNLPVSYVLTGNLPVTYHQ